MRRLFPLVTALLLAGCGSGAEQDQSNRYSVPEYGADAQQSELAGDAELIGAPLDASPTPAAAPDPAPEPVAEEEPAATPDAAADRTVTDARPSFACDGALSRAETLICADRRLARLDREMARDYAIVRDAAGSNQRREVLANQRAFLARRDACGSAACVEDAYRARAAALAGPTPPADSCAAEIGARRAAALVRQCLRVSPATRPPCNVANSCAMIQDEIDRSEALLDEEPGERE